MSGRAETYQWAVPIALAVALGVNDATVVFGSVRLRMLSGEAKPLRP
jgi:hypothetical protein